MRADNDIDLTFTNFAKRFFLFVPRCKSIESADIERKFCHAATECLIMLFGQHGCGNKHGNLKTTVHRLESGSHRHFGFSITHISADQAIHRPSVLHVGLGGDDRRHLIVGFGVRKTGIELSLPIAVAVERDAGASASASLQF